MIIDCEQGSEEWFAARLGKASASRMADITALTKTGYGASRANYLAELVAQRLTGVYVCHARGGRFAKPIRKPSF